MLELFVRQLDSKEIGSLTVSRVYFVREKYFEVVVIDDEGEFLEEFKFSEKDGILSTYKFLDLCKKYSPKVEAKNGINIYCPEMGQVEPSGGDFKMEASYRTNHVYLYPLHEGLELKGRGIKWEGNCYRVTDNAFNKIFNEYKFIRESLLD